MPKESTFLIGLYFLEFLIIAQKAQKNSFYIFLSLLTVSKSMHTILENRFINFVFKFL